MEKLDLKKKYKTYYTAAKKPEFREIEAAQYISITGKGDPNSEAYTDRVQALFSVAFTLKFASKQEGKDFVVPKLEGLWWFDDAKYGQISLGEAPQLIPRSEWHWRMMIRMPEFVGPQALTAAVDTVWQKKQPALAREVEWFTRSPERVVQILHVGPFEREPETLLILQQFVEEQDLKKAGHHHEIYLSDINRVDPEKWRTILREPVG
jgi:hypothetical protein